MGRPGLLVGGIMGEPQEIQLQNPVAREFAAYIFGNATKCDRVATENSAVGQHLILCGAGPSLADHAAEWCPKGDQIWGCNSAVTWLYEQGHRPTHGFTVDQTPHMCEEWATAPPVEYLVATSVCPHLITLLEGRQRPITFFHNYVGVVGRPVRYGVCKRCGAVLNEDRTVAELLQGSAQILSDPACLHKHVHVQTESYEDWLYAMLYPPTIRCGSGLNSVNRALDLALFLGFDRITVLGADCALRVSMPRPADVVLGSPAHRAWLEDACIMHVDGGNPLAAGASMMTLDGVIDGRRWTSKPDMLVSAVWLVKAARESAGRIQLIGDTLPVALLDKPDSFLGRLPTMVNSHGDVIGLPGIK